MRVIYRNIEIPKSAARKVAVSTGSKLSDCQRALASVSGYVDWHDLERVTALTSDLEDWHSGQETLAALISGLAGKLAAAAGDIQHALSHTPIIPREWSLADRVRLRALVFRKMDIPDAGRRKPGAVGRFKYDKRPLILRSFGELAFCVSDGTPSIAMADFEYISPRVSAPLFIPSRLYLAYGELTEADGSNVLFSRDYIPLWRVRAGGVVERISPRLWIDYVEQRWFWGDHNAPWDKELVRQKELARLSSYGVRGVPKLVEALPRLVLTSTNERIRSVARDHFGPWIYSDATVRRGIDAFD